MRSGIPALIALLALAGCRTSTPEHPASAREPASGIRLRDVAADNGIDFVAGITDRSPLNITRLMAGGIGFLDYDTDGWPDLVVCGIRGAALYHNEQGKGFRDATRGSGLDSLRGEPQGVAAADYDGDGRVDLLVTLYDGIALLKNTGGHFGDVTREAGLTLGGWTTSAAFADVDGDSWLDLYVGRYVRFAPGMPEFRRNGDALLTLGPDAYEAEPGVFFRGNGRGGFREATREAGLAEAHGKTLGVIFADYDGDGDQDLYLANDQTLADFYVNDGHGRFRNMGLENGTAVAASGRAQSGMGVDWGDYDGDGRLDLVVTTFYNEAKSLYHQGTGGMFEDRSQLAGLSAARLPWTGFGVAFLDLDNDGEPDLVIANGHPADQIDRVLPSVGYRQPPQVFANSGAVFRDVSPAAGPAFQQRIAGRGLAAADFDGDGRLDVAIASLTGPPLLLHNESKAGNWVTVRLQGRGPNHSTLGATVSVNDGRRTQVQTIQTGRSYMAAFLPEAHFGLGQSGSASAEVHWPDGRVQRVPALRINSVNAIQER